MQGRRKLLLRVFIPHILKRSAGFIFMSIFICLAGTQVFGADKFGIGQFSVNPNPFTLNQNEVVTISGVVYHLNPEGNLSSPSITIEIKGQASLPVTITLLSEEMLTKDSLATLGEWSFTATWNGTDARGQIVAPGEYVCEINLDLPNVGKDTKSATITVNTIE